MSTNPACALVIGLENLGLDPMKPTLHPTPAQQAILDRMAGFSEEQRASLKALWVSRRAAQTADRVTCAKGDHTKGERRMATQWGRKHPGLEMVLMRDMAKASPSAQVAWFKALMRGVDVASVLIDHTLDATQGSAVLDFSDTGALADLGWPMSYAFPVEWRFNYRRIRIEGVPVLEVTLVSGRRMENRA